MLLGGKSLKIIDLLEIEFMPICHLKVILLTSECTFVIVAYFLYNNLGPDYMSRASPVSRAGVSLPGSRHVCCQTQQKSTPRLHDNWASPVSRDPSIAVP